MPGTGWPGYLLNGCLNEQPDRDGTIPWIGKIVREVVSGDSWLVGTDGRRHWVPTGIDYRCLQDKGIEVVNLEWASISLISDAIGDHAVCTPRRFAGHWRLWGIGR